jgi:hypothetical protein
MQMNNLTQQDNSSFKFYTRQADGVSGMTVTALSDFCGTEQQTITQLLNRLRDSDPITNDLTECLKPFAGNDWRLITNDSHGSTFIMDEVCHAVLEYYALEARKYKGKTVAIANYRTVSKAGLRVFIWSQTGYSPISESLNTRVTSLEQRLATALDTISQLQSQIQPLLPPDSNTPPPGWNAEVWQQLPPQDKRHFQWMHRRRRFRPSNRLSDELLALPVSTEEIKQQQRSEVDQLVGEISQEEKARVDAMKEALFARLDAEV